MAIRVLQPTGIEDVLTFLHNQATDEEVARVETLLQERRQAKPYVRVPCVTPPQFRKRKGRRA